MSFIKIQVIRPNDQFIKFLHHRINHTFYNLSGGKTLNQERGQDKENIRTVHEQLCKELSSLQRDYKHVRQVVDTLQQDYERSKDFDPLRRYGLLKGMIKRTILHFKLNEDKLPGSISITGIRSLANSYKELSYTMELTRRKADLDGESSLYLPHVGGRAKSKTFYKFHAVVQ